MTNPAGKRGRSLSHIDDGVTQQHQGRPPRRHWQAGIRPHWIEIAIAVALITVGAAQVCIYLRQAGIMDEQARISARQLDAMENDQRPWIKPTFQLLGFRFTDTGDAEITYASNFKNVGKTPAQNIKSRIAAAVVTEQTAIKSVAEEEEQCKLAARDSTNETLPGIFLFPGEEAPELIGGRGAGRAYVSASQFAKGWPQPNHLIFKLVGCFDYTFSKESGRHGQTGFAYFISKKSPNGTGMNLAFTPVAGSVPIDQIAFELDPFSGGFVN
jgi:hypothetical protein